MSLKSLLIHLSPSLLSPEKYRTFLLLTCIPLLSLFLSLFCWNLEPTVSRDGLLYLELVQVWHDHGSFQAVLEYWPRFWIPPFPLYLMKLLTGGQAFDSPAHEKAWIIRAAANACKDLLRSAGRRRS